MKIVEIIQANAAFAGFLGVILGAMISLIGTLLQTYLSQKNEKKIYERTYREKIRNEKKELYVKCLMELKNIKKQFYYDGGEESKEYISTNNLESELLMELQATPRVMQQLKSIIGLRLQETELEIFEKEYEKLVSSMRDDIGGEGG